MLCLGKTKHYIPTQEPHPNHEAQWWENHGLGLLAIIDGTMNSGLNQQILHENVRASVCELKLNRKWVMQQDDDPKHKSKSTTEWLKQKRFGVLEWPSQSPDLNPI